MDKKRYMMLEKAQRLAEIIIRVKLGSASREDREALVAWLDEDEEHRRLYQRIIRGKSFAQHLKVEEEIQQSLHVERVRDQILRRMKSKKRRWLRVVGWSSVAAACIWGGVVFFDGVKEKKQETTEAKSITKEIKRGDGRVVLILEDGKRFHLVEGENDRSRLAKMTLLDSTGRLSYRERRATSPVEREEYHKVVTTTGGDYHFTLSDGTRVWLNAKSELIYPVRFLGKQRVVDLKGEAYFEVAADSVLPFIVKAGGVQTRVLGTSFNVSAYEDEAVVKTTLVSGKVWVDSEEPHREASPVLLSPGMQSRWEKEDGKLSVHRVKVSHELAWRQGMFVFDEDDLGTITRVLARWFNVRFVFIGDSSNKHTFSGRMSKEESLDSILKIFTLAGGPRFKIDNNMVYIIEGKALNTE